MFNIPHWRSVPPIKPPQEKSMNDKTPPIQALDDPWESAFTKTPCSLPVKADEGVINLGQAHEAIGHKLMRLYEDVQMLDRAGMRPEPELISAIRALESQAAIPSEHGFPLQAASAVRQDPLPEKLQTGCQSAPPRDGGAMQRDPLNDRKNALYFAVLNVRCDIGPLNLKAAAGDLFDETAFDAIKESLRAVEKAFTFPLVGASVEAFRRAQDLVRTMSAAVKGGAHIPPEWFADLYRIVESIADSDRKLKAPAPSPNNDEGMWPKLSLLSDATIGGRLKKLREVIINVMNHGAPGSWTEKMFEEFLHAVGGVSLDVAEAQRQGFLNVSMACNARRSLTELSIGLSRMRSGLIGRETLGSDAFEDLLSSLDAAYQALTEPAGLTTHYQHMTVSVHGRSNGCVVKPGAERVVSNTKVFEDMISDTHAGPNRLALQRRTWDELTDHPSMPFNAPHTVVHNPIDYVQAEKSGRTVEELVAWRNSNREHFIAQYLEATGAAIENVELVEQHVDGVIKMWCQPRKARSPSTPAEHPHDVVLKTGGIDATKMAAAFDQKMTIALDEALKASWDKPKSLKPVAPAWPHDAGPKTKGSAGIHDKPRS